jgi:hypothetical protein
MKSYKKEKNYMRSLLNRQVMAMSSSKPFMRASQQLRILVDHAQVSTARMVTYPAC